VQRSWFTSSASRCNQIQAMSAGQPRITQDVAQVQDSSAGGAAIHERYVLLYHPFHPGSGGMVEAQSNTDRLRNRNLLDAHGKDTGFHMHE